MTLDVVICTYNRPEKICDLVTQILSCDPLPNKIIVVDSSDIDNDCIEENSKIEYIKSPRKSQPYQRSIGAQQSTADIVCYFDDDIQIIEKSLFYEIKKGFENNDVAGLSLGIIYENGIEIIKRKKVKTNTKSNTGKISWLGRTTGLPEKIDFVQYLPGPVMAFRHAVLKNVFDEYLFTIFEKKIAMGEDKYISMKASNFGKLLFIGDKTYIYHPPEPSTYFKNEIDFIAKTTFSRLWLSKQFAITNKKPLFIAYLYFYLYLMKQLTFGLTNKNKFKGNIKALKLILTDHKTNQDLSINESTQNS